MTAATLTGIPADQLTRYVERTGSPPRIPIDVVTRRHRGHFFDPGTMRFFGSRLPLDGYALPNGGAVFVTSEQQPPDYAIGATYPRRWTVRVQSPDGDMPLEPSERAEGGTLEPLEPFGFQRYETRTQAARACRAYALRVWLEPDTLGAHASAGRARGWPPKYIADALGISYQKVTALLEQED